MLYMLFNLLLPAFTPILGITFIIVHFDFQFYKYCTKIIQKGQKKARPQLAMGLPPERAFRPAAATAAQQSAAILAQRYCKNRVIYACSPSRSTSRPNNLKRRGKFQNAGHHRLSVLGTKAVPDADQRKLSRTSAGTA